jgi:hypothetical protein
LRRIELSTSSRCHREAESTQNTGTAQEQREEALEQVFGHFALIIVFLFSGRIFALGQREK